MAICGEWIAKSARIGASLGGVAGFFYGTYIMATSHALSWTDVSDTMESGVVVLVTAVMIGSLCIAIGGLAGLVLGIVASPLSSFRQETEAKKGKLTADFLLWVCGVGGVLLIVLLGHYVWNVL
jgi:hypothetical protein